jgi:ferric-dicitrate binding protein FerR (iron transport regulator)
VSSGRGNPARRTRKHVAIAGGLLLVVGVAGALLMRATTAPSPRAIRLSDGTEVLFRSDTKVTPRDTYPHPREIGIDGQAFVITLASEQLLVIRSRLMLLTVRGPSVLRVDAWSKETGEQVQVLRGHVTVRKAYRSAYTEPDVLGGGEMSMVNVTIDLMEKEKLKPDELRALEQDFAAASGARGPKP